MAVYKPGPLGEFSGNLGSISAAHGRRGKVLRMARACSKTVTPAQAEARRDLAFYARAWRSPAMDTFRSSWNAYAATHPVPDRFGTPRLLSGYQHFLRTIPLMQYYEFSNNMAPFQSKPYQIVSLAAALTVAPSLTILTYGAWDPGYTIEQVAIARFQPTLGSNRKPSFRNIAIYAKADDTTVLTTELEALDLVPVSGETWLIRVTWWYSFTPPQNPHLCRATAS